jgi:hypothetical protein
VHAGLGALHFLGKKSVDCWQPCTHAPLNRTTISMIKEGITGTRTLCCFY